MNTLHMLIAVRVEVELVNGSWCWWAYRKDGREPAHTENAFARSVQRFDTEEQAIADAHSALQPDRHAIAAIELFGTLTPETRAKAKEIRFAANYGMQRK